MNEPETPPPGPEGEPELSAEQAEMLRQMEEEMRQIRVQDLLAQSVVSILNLAYRRIVKEDERDLAQARVGIDAIRATVDLLEPEPQREVKNALSQVQMLYAQQTGGAAPEEGSPPAASGDAPGGGTPRPAEGAGPAQKAPSRLWTPGSG